jgi:hypothetical protein
MYIGFHVSKVHSITRHEGTEREQKCSSSQSEPQRQMGMVNTVPWPLYT